MSNKISGISRTIAAIVLVIIIAVSGVLIYVYYTSTLPKPTLTVYALWSGSEEDNFRQVLGNFTENTGINVTYNGFTTQELLISARVSGALKTADHILSVQRSCVENIG